MAHIQKQFANNRKLFVAFIDFWKINNVWFNLQTAVVTSPIKNWIKRKLYVCIKSVYDDVKAKVRCGENSVILWAALEGSNKETYVVRFCFPYLLTN